MIVAKPVIQNQFWILKENDQKVGNILANHNGFQVRIQDQVTTYTNINTIAERGIRFEPGIVKTPDPVKHSTVHGFPAVGKVFNPTWDVRKGLPLYTKTRKSKSWFCGGWFRIKQSKNWQVTQSPKLIVVQRYPSQGPFYTEEQAREKPVTEKQP